MPNPELDIGSESALVTFVNLRVLSLAILSTSEQDANEDGLPDNFNFLTGASIRIRGNFNGTTLQTLVASLPENDPQIGNATRILEFTVIDNVDIFDFLLLSDGYEVVLELEGNVPPDSVILSGELTYRIGIGI